MIRRKDLYTALADSAFRFPDKTALVETGTKRSVTYMELLMKVDRAADMFFEHGVRKGDRVAVAHRNSIDTVVANFGLYKLGAVCIPMNFMVTKPEELEFILKDSGAKAVVTQAEFIRHYVKVLPSLPDIKYIFSTDEIPTVLEQNWNRNDNQHIFFTHRYSLGFRRKVKMTEEEIKARKFAIESEKENEALKEKEEARKRMGDDFDEEAFDGKPTFAGRPDDAKIVGDEPVEGEAPAERIAVTSTEVADSLLAEEQKAAEDTMWMKTEYVPVTSFIHTAEFNNSTRI